MPCNKRNKGPRDGYSVEKGHGGMKRNRHNEEETVGAKIMRGVGKALTVGAAAYGAKKIGDGLSDIGEGLDDS